MKTTRRKVPTAYHVARERAGGREHWAVWRIPGTADAKGWRRLALDGDPRPHEIADALDEVQADLEAGRDPRGGGLTVDAWIDAYLKHVERNQKPNTYDLAARGLDVWRAWLHANAPALASPRDLTYFAHVEPFITERRESPRMVPVAGKRFAHAPDPSGAKLAARTVNLELRAIRGICRWSLETDERGQTRGHLVTDPTAPAKKLPEPEPPTHALEQGAARAVEATLARGRGDGLIHARLHRVFIETGRRTHELFGCRRSDLQAEAARLAYRDEKTGKARHVDLSAHAVEWLREWAAREELPDDDRAAFLVPVTRRAFVERLRRASQAVGLKRYGPHTLRHTHGSWALDAGATLREVQDLLGHKSITTTARYTHVARGRLTEVRGKLWDARVADWVAKPEKAPTSKRNRKAK